MFETRRMDAYQFSSSLPRKASGAPAIPTIPPPRALSIRISAGVSYLGPSVHAITISFRRFFLLSEPALAIAFLRVGQYGSGTATGGAGGPSSKGLRRDFVKSVKCEGITI